MRLCCVAYVTVEALEYWKTSSAVTPVHLSAALELDPLLFSLKHGLIMLFCDR